MINKLHLIVLLCGVSILNLSFIAASGGCGSSIGCSSRSISDDCGNGCSMGNCSNGVLSGCSNSCDNQKNGCTDVSTFFLPRPILTDLTYRNNISFYQRYHDGCCSFFTYEAVWLYQKNRNPACVGLGFFGNYPVTVSQQNGDIASLNLSLGSSQPDGFLSTFTFRPKRTVFGWLPHILFNLDCFCTGLWVDLATAVLSVHHQSCLNEKVVTPGEINKLTTPQEAFDALDVFAPKRRHTGVDDIEVRLGYDWLYCDNDHIGIYLDGIIPTGRHFDNTRWFQPVVGSRSGALGFGISADMTLWDDECDQTAFVAMTELKYLYRFRNQDKRIFDLTNGPLSRFLLVAPEDNPYEPISGTTLLRRCVKIENRSLLEWWLSFHYQWCKWGFEAAYNLFFRDNERIQPQCVNFYNYGIYDMTRCSNLTSHSTAVLSDGFGQGTPDETFVPLTTKDVNFASAAAGKALSHTFSASVAYNSLWRECYPWNIGLSISYEVPCKNRRRTTLENWGVFGKWTMSY